MKKIEQMAKRHAEEQLRPEASELMRIYSQMDYEAGFRACREMATERVKTLRVYSDPCSSDRVVWMVDPRDLSLMDLLGEERVTQSQASKNPSPSEDP